jgi:hypothetical protein
MSKKADSVIRFRTGGIKKIGVGAGNNGDEI